MNIFTRTRNQLVAQRYRWIREGINAGITFMTTSVAPSFLEHVNHTGCDCLSDKVFWMLEGYNHTVKKGERTEQ